MHVFLDESGDLGFDFKHKNSSNFFTITVLSCYNERAVNNFVYAINKTSKNKLSYKKSSKRKFNELKGTNLLLHSKKYFLRYAKSNHDWNLNSIIIDKRKFLLSDSGLIDDTNKLYNYLSGLVLRRAVNKGCLSKLEIAVDRCKPLAERYRFDEYIRAQLSSSIPKSVKIKIDHLLSTNHKGLQAVDLFAWGILRKYECGDTNWYDSFSEKMETEVLLGRKQTAPDAVSSLGS